MNGIEIAKFIRELDNHNDTIPIIAVSAHMKTVERTHINYFFSKPVNFGLLNEKLKELIYATGEI
jgi:response regulator RpfG family c-di-GMP phosphodiesterase